MRGEWLRAPLDGPSLLGAVTGPATPWRKLDVVAETGSTNADLLARARAGEDIDGAVLIADHQTAGRGRGSRTWSTAPCAQIAMSVGVGGGGVHPDAWGWLPLAAGVAVVDAVAAMTDAEIGLKWPNDVLAGGGKLAGILAEVAAPNPVIVVGIGLNVTLSAEEAGEPGVMSLLDLGVAAPDRDAIVRGLLRELGTRIEQWHAAGGGDATLAADYRARSLTVGSDVRVFLPGDRQVVGRARAIDEQGRLVVDAAEETMTLSAGDVVHLRPML
jgi:BirA family biotin operon repressor/biotin-[acetyl-CoA-carboxylase] ligase